MFTAAGLIRGTNKENNLARFRSISPRSYGREHT
ncbi:hypothetical protein EE612_039216 [Oryza sativa]|nr:hypothetical protein EE612_039216 [Oryza sativa]